MALNGLLHVAARLAAELRDDDWSVGPRPPASASVHSSGPAAFRVLLFGGGPAVGYGVASHDLSLAGHLARRLTRVTGAGVDMDVVTQTNLRCRDMPRLMVDVDVDRYDMVFVSVGIQDLLDFEPADVWARDVEGVLRMFRRTPERPLPIFAIAVPQATHILPIDRLLGAAADRRASEFNERLHTLCDLVPEATFVPFAPDDRHVTGRHRDSVTYGHWADVIIDSVAPLLQSVQHSAQPIAHEAARQAALDRIGILDTPPEVSFDTVTRTACRYFGSVGAAISFLDHDRQWFKSTVGVSVSELPRAIALCDHTINTYDGFTVEDATQDPRFADSYFAVTAKLRSYAGVPIRDAHGYMIGTLCVFDDKPRKFSTEEMVYLRDLAYLIEERLLVFS